MDFSNIARQLNEENPAMAATRSSGEKALAGGESQINKTNQRKDRQKAQMATQSSVPQKSDVSYTSEEARMEREKVKMYENAKSDWRTELVEESDHPYVDIMPSVNQKAMETKKQMKDDAKMEGQKQAKMAEEMSVADQMKVSRKSLKPVPKGGYDHQKIRGERMKKAPRIRSKSMEDLTKPRVGSSD